MYYEGDWDQALAQIADLIAEIESRRPHELHGVGQSLGASAHPRCARRRGRSGRRRGALARPSPGSRRTPSCCTRRWPAWPPSGRRSATWKRPLRLVDELFDELAGTSDSGVRLLADRGRLRARPARARRRARRGARPDQGALAVGRGRTRIRLRRASSAAADILAEIGSKPDEAYARLRSGNEADVRRALDFYRSVGATRYLDEGESMLATSRSA